MISLFFSIPAIAQDIVADVDPNNFLCQDISDDEFSECVGEYEACTIAHAVQNQQEGICHKAFMICAEVKKFFICMNDLEKMNPVASSFSITSK